MSARAVDQMARAFSSLTESLIDTIVATELEVRPSSNMHKPQKGVISKAELQFLYGCALLIRCCHSN
jgi:hypothetical protein